MRLLVACLVVACGERFYLPPAPGGPGTEILHIDSERTLVVDASSTFVHTWKLRGDATYEAMVFDSTPQELGLQPSWDLREGRTVDPGDYEKFTAQISDGAFAWKTIDVPTEWMASVRLPSPCSSLQQIFFEPIPDGLTPVGVIRDDGGTLLVTGGRLTAPRFFRVSASGFAGIPSDLDRKIHFAFRAPDDRIVLAGDGEYWIGDPSSGFALLTSNDPLNEMHDSVMDDRGIIYGLAANDRSHRIYRIEGSSWTMMFDIGEALPICVGTACPIGGISLGEAGEIFVVSRASRQPLVFTGREWTREDTEIDADFANGKDRLDQVRHVPGVGTFAGSGAGQVLERTDSGSWRKIRASIYNSPIRVLEPVLGFRGIDRGLFLSGDSFVDQYYRSFGQCPDPFRTRGFLAKYAAVIEGGVALAGSLGTDPYFGILTYAGE